MKYVEAPWSWRPLGSCPACPFLNPALNRIQKHFLPVVSRAGGPAEFLGLAVVYGPMFLGTALHGFGRTYHICSGAQGHHVLISNMNRVPFCVISGKRCLRMRKIAFQRF